MNLESVALVFYVAYVLLLVFFEFFIVNGWRFALSIHFLFIESTLESWKLCRKFAVSAAAATPSSGH